MALIDRRTLLVGSGVGVGWLATPGANARAASRIGADNLRVAALQDPPGIGDTRPMLSWQVTGPARTSQAAWRIRVTSDPAMLESGTADLRDSGRIESTVSTGVYFPMSASCVSNGCASRGTARLLPKWSRAIGGIIAAMVLAASPLKAEPSQVAIAIRPAVDRPGPLFEGWGTALAWFAEVTGGYPDATRERLADLLYGPDGLGWTIARYNIGGGNAADTPPYLRPGAAVPGFWRRPEDASGSDWWRPDDPAMWDWSADTNQRWWLDAIRKRVRAPIFEAFSNSPPWFMTVSGRVSGAGKGTDDNLRSGQEDRFAVYLARVVGELQRRHHITFRTLSPFNEPNTDYWFAANTQEGSHWSPARQAAMIDAAAAALTAQGLATTIAAPDETNSHLFVRDWAAYPPATRARIGQLNVHSYGTVHQTAVRDIARMSGIRLWMSENDTPLEKEPEDFDGMPSALAFAEHVIHDLKRLEPSAWVFWQAVETISARDGAPGSNWGLIKMDLSAAPDAPHPIHVTAKYWAMAMFSRYIRPGYRLLPVDDADTVGAMAPDGRTLVLVHMNPGPFSRALTIAVPRAAVREVIVTDTSRQAVRVASKPHPALVAPPESVTTVVMAIR